jgi:hypothetical protein
MLTQKAQEKEKRKKGVFVMILLFLLQHSEAARTDRLFRNGLSSLAYAPSKPLSTSQIQQAAEEAPSSPGVFVATHRAALATATIAGVVGGVCIWQVARTSLDNSPLQEPVAPTESPASLPSDTITKSNLQTAANLPTEASEATTLAKARKSESKPKIIVVTKEIVVNDTVFVRDTAIVKDTVYLMQKP